MLCGFSGDLVVFHIRIVRVVVSQGSYEQNSIKQRATDEVAHHLDPPLHPRVPSICSLGRPPPQRCHLGQRGSCSPVRLARQACYRRGLLLYPVGFVNNYTLSRKYYKPPGSCVDWLRNGPDEALLI
jgi:hypothetical protein